MIAEQVAAQLIRDAARGRDPRVVAVLMRAASWVERDAPVVRPAQWDALEGVEVRG